MYLYYVLFFLFIIINFLLKGRAVIDGKVLTGKSKKAYVIIVFGIMFLLSALKATGVGVDTPHYKEIFEWLNRSGRFGIYEPGFALFCRWVGTLFGDFQFLIIFSSVFMYLPYALYIYYESDDVVFSSLMFYVLYFIEFNAMMRQGMAMGLVVLALLIYKRKKSILLYIIIVALAFTFHYSAIIAIIFPFIKKFKFTFTQFFFVIIVSIVLTKINFVEKVLVASGIETLYLSYLKESGAGGTDALLQVALAFDYLLMYYIIGNTGSESIKRFDSLNGCPTEKNNKKFKVFGFDAGAILLYVMFFIMTVSIRVLARVAMYFGIGFLTLLPRKIANEVNGRKKLGVYVGVFAGYLLYQTLVFVYRPTWGGVFPYKFFW